MIAWTRGLIEEYRAFLPVTGRQPGRHAPGRRDAACCPRRGLSERVGAQRVPEVRRANPTGSFKDRGMTLAISKAVEEGAQAVVCGSRPATPPRRRRRTRRGLG